jgi:hypothetical protein
MLLAALVLSTSVHAFHTSSKSDTPIEFSKPVKSEGGLGTTGYSETALERKYSEKVTEKDIRFTPKFAMPKPSNMTDEEWAKFQKEQKAEEARQKDKLIPEEKYQLADQVGVYVGWFGIVREAVPDAKSGTVRLTLEHKYFDGLVDLHQMIVSLHGAGDFTASLHKKDAWIPPLALVRVYGKVGKDKAGAPLVTAEFVRVWDWGVFAFMNYGKDRSNPQWVGLRTRSDDQSYAAAPKDDYYESLLGKRK